LRSLISILNEIKETVAGYKIISDLDDVIVSDTDNKNIGLLKAPVPYEKADEIIDFIIKNATMIVDSDGDD